MQRALEQSLLEQRSPRGRERAMPQFSQISDPELCRALQESLEEEELRR